MIKTNLSIKNKIFLIFSAVIIISIAVIGYFGYKSASDAYINSAFEINKHVTNSKVIEMEEKISSTPTDVLFMANSYSLQKHLMWKNIGEPKKMKRWLDAFSNVTTDLMLGKKIYYQIRVLDLKGNEVLNYRYNKSINKIIVTPKEELQNKKHKEYFKKSIQLKKGEFFISKMDLNMEFGRIEVPHIPVVRYSTPIVNKNGETLGIVIFNLFADEILKLIDNLNQNPTPMEHYLVNKNGFYLYHEDKNKRWGFQLNHKANFRSDYRDVFDTMKKKDEGTFLYKDHIYSFKRVHPLEHISKNEYWYLISTIKTSKALSNLNTFKVIFATMVIVILTLAFFIISSYIKKIIRPLNDVNNKLKALSKGEIVEDVIDYKAHDEISEIVDSSDILIEAIKETIKQANSIANGDFSKQVELLGENDQLGLAIENMNKRLQEIEQLAQKLSIGDYSIDIVAKGQNDKLSLALISMVSYLENITKVAESISVGELEVKYELKSADDRLGCAVLDMLGYLKNIQEHANYISEENFSVNIIPKSKNDDLGISLSKMTNMLEQNNQRNKGEIWFSEGVGRFTDSMIGLDNIYDVSKKAIAMICKYIKASSGVIYIYNKETDNLELSSTYAFTYRTSIQKKYKIGEGIIGQVALDKEAIELENVMDYEYIIQSGTSVSKPKSLIAIPLLHEKELFGVIEVMSFNEFKKLDKDYLLKSSNVLATTIHTTIQSVKIKELLGESQSAYEELQVKSEELEAQSEELRVANEQMQEQSNILEMQSASLKIRNIEIENAKKEIDQRANELEQSNKYKSEFLANMSHELRTPLNSVILLSSLLSKNSKGNLIDADIQKAKVINESGSELLRLINDILDLSKIESGKMELLIDRINSDDLLKSYNEVFSHTAQEKGIDFIVKDDFKSNFFNDRDRLGQILRNLLSNAFKFTSSGSITLYIEDNKDEKFPVKISVSDTGVGIPKDKQDLIFKAFTQADGSTSRQFGGTGLGLSISKELAHLMKGEIELFSKEGLGSTFTLYLPSLEESFDENDVHHTIEEDKTVLNKKEKISNKEQFLIIEDDKNYAHTLQSIIEDNGSKAFVANNGKDGLKLAKEHQIAGVLVDIGLPDMSGIEVIRILKDDPLTKHIHIQVISGLDENNLNIEKDQIDGYLQKPVSNEQIIKAIHHLESLYQKEPKSILIVENDTVHLKAIKNYIEDESHLEITMAKSISEAQKYLEEKYFDIAIVDLGLDDGRGEDICKIIKKKRKDTNILIYTGKDLSFQEADYLNEISDEIIIKNPNSHERLKDEIKRFLDEPESTVNSKIEEYIESHEKNESDINLDTLIDKKVLIVDDDMKNIFVLSSALGEHDMDISHAKNGKEAIEHLEENPDTDIVLMDIMMPVMNGYEAIESIRKDENLKHLPIIAVTAKAMQSDKEKAINAGADDYLTKPVDLDKLTKMIYMWLNKNS